MSEAQRTPKSKTGAYGTWRSMRDRCLRPSARSYEYYGARGITICQAWLESFDAFLRDMGPRPEGRTIDRIEKNGNYEPGNCRWATRAEQSRNRAVDKEKLRASMKAAMAKRFAGHVHPWDAAGLKKPTYYKRLRAAAWAARKAALENLLQIEGVNA